MTSDLDKDIEEVEAEEGNDLSLFGHPLFDPNKFKVRSSTMSIDMLLAFVESGTINLDTEFQRLPNLWDVVHKSRFIESLLLRLPIPSFYFAEGDENRLEVVDGLQRISTLRSFVSDLEFKLQGLEFLVDYNGLEFAELSKPLQLRIKMTQLNIYIVDKDTPDVVKFNIFSRINQGGLSLKPQEIRHALNHGAPANLIADLVRGKADTQPRKSPNDTDTSGGPTAAGKAFVKATDWKISTTRMEDRDFANRFVAFYLTPYSDYVPDLDSFLSEGLVKVKSLTQAQVLTLKSDFESAMLLAFDIFGNDAFRKRFAIADSRKPINKALFEVLSVCFAKLNVSQREMLKKKKKLVVSRLRNLHQDAKFVRSITQGTAQKDTVLYRFSSIERMLNDVINEG